MSANSKNKKRNVLKWKNIEVTLNIQDLSKKKRKREHTSESLPSLHNVDVWERSLAWPALQGLALFSSDALTGSLSRAPERLGRAGIDPKPSPLSPGNVRIVAAANLTALSVNSSHTGFTGGQFAQPAGSTLRRPVDPAAPAGRQIHTTPLH